MKKVHITHVGNEHNRWLRGLNFYKTEIGFLKTILTEIASKNTGSDVMKEVEHFENQFKVQTDNIDRLAHDIHVNIDTIGREAQNASAGYIDGALLTRHQQLGEQYDAIERVATETIQSFRRFAEQWM